MVIDGGEAAKMYSGYLNYSILSFVAFLFPNTTSLGMSSYQRLQTMTSRHYDGLDF
jgi:hypothetical protein